MKDRNQPPYSDLKLSDCPDGVRRDYFGKLLRYGPSSGPAKAMLDLILENKELRGGISALEREVERLASMPEHVPNAVEVDEEGIKAIGMWEKFSDIIEEAIKNKGNGK